MIKIDRRSKREIGLRARGVTGLKRHWDQEEIDSLLLLRKVIKINRSQKRSTNYTENHGPILPEPSGEGIYAEQARRMRRRVNRVPEKDGLDGGEDREGEGTMDGATDAVEENDVDLREREPQEDHTRGENHEHGEEEPVDQDPLYSPTSEITPEEEVVEERNQPR